MANIFDLTSVVDQVIKAERRFLDQRIQENQDRNKESSDLSTIKNKLRTFQTALRSLTRTAAFETKKTSVSDSSIVSATPALGAAEITYNLDVNSLATPARVQSSGTLFGTGYQGTQTTLTGGEVNTTMSQSLNPNATLQSGNMNLDAGKTITAGSFVLNGATITVTNGDTVNTLLTKINNSSANVTAHYDSSTDKVVIEHDTIGSAQLITLGSDSSGFFNALKLNGSQGEASVAGTAPHLLTNLDDTALSGVSGGYFTINNRTFFVDPSEDSLNDVIKRINSSTAGVSLFYDETSNKVTMTSEVDGKSISIGNDTSGFLNAIKVLDVAGDTNGTSGASTYAGTGSSVTVNGTTIASSGNTFTINGTQFNLLSEGEATVKVEANQETVLAGVKGMVEAYNDAVKTMKGLMDGNANLNRTFSRTLREMRRMFAASVANPGTLNHMANIGISFDRGAIDAPIQLDESKFKAQLNSDPESVAKLFSFDSDQDGLRDDGGIANNLNNYLKNITNTALGTIDKKRSTLANNISREERVIVRDEIYFEKRHQQLLDQMLNTQKILEKLQQSLNNASTVRVDFDLARGQGIK